jgi:hypothetical protein
VLIDIEDIDTSFRVSRATPKGHLRVDVGGSTARDVLIPCCRIYAALPGYPHRPWRGRPAGRSHQR